MKRIDEFSTEEVGEEWLRELYKVIALRRGTMFRLITESARMLLYGNAGGSALIIGFMSNAATTESAFYHWSLLLALVVFGTGILMSALTLILVTMVSVKEAQGAENGLKQFVDGNLDRTNVLFTVETATFRLADYTTLAGTVSAACFMIGGLISLILLVIFF